MNVVVREAKGEDIQEMLQIYRYYVENTAISFEEEVPTIEAFKKRIMNFQTKYPVLVVTIDSHVAGYAYAHAFRDFSAYDKVAEVTVYLKNTMKSKGLATLLYEELEKQLHLKGIVKTIACITADNEQSLVFHEKCGYQIIATFKEIGIKFNQWQDVVWLEKKIEH